MGWSLRSQRLLLASLAVTTGLSSIACLLPSFSDVLPEPGSDAQPPADAGDEGDGSLSGCDDVAGAFVVFPMTEGKGTTIHDCTGKYTGTFGAGVAWTTGRSGLPALQFSGGMVTVVDAHELRVVGPFTVAAWVEPATTQTDQFGDVVARYESINAAVWGLAITKDPQVVFTAFSAPITQASANGLTFGKFTHVAGTYDSTTIAVFRDGSPGQSGPGPAALGLVPVPITIGANSVGTSAFHGKIAGVRIYKRVLTLNEINALSLK